MNTNLKLKEYENGDEFTICELFNKVYETPLLIEYWDWRFKNSPSGTALILLACDEKVLASHYAVTPVKLSIESKNHLTALSGTTMTNPNYRGQGLFPLLAEDVYSSMKSKGMTIVWGFPNVISHRTFIKNLSWFDIYEIPFFRLKLNSLNAIPEQNNKIKKISRFDESFSDMWEIAKTNYPIIAFRNKEQLNWRYVDTPHEDYSILAYYNSDHILGYAVYKKYENELQIIDILTAQPAPNIGSALVFEVVKLAIDMKLDAVSMWLNVNTPLHHELEKYGFKDDAPITYFGARILNDFVSENIIYNFSNWYLTMGDSDVF